MCWAATGLRDAGLKPTKPSVRLRRIQKSFDVVTTVLIGGRGSAGAGFGYRFDAGWISVPFWTVCGYFIGYLGGTTRLLKGDELKRVLVMFILVVFSVIFWMTYEQAGLEHDFVCGSTHAKSIFGWEFPSSWFQSVPAIFVILLGTGFCVHLAEDGDATAFEPGQVCLWFVLCRYCVCRYYVCGQADRSGPRVAVVVGRCLLYSNRRRNVFEPRWAQHDLRLSPVRMVGLMLGVWFLSISIGSYIAGRTTSLFDAGTPEVLTRAFGIFAGITLAAALLLAVITPLINKMTPRPE